MSGLEQLMETLQAFDVTLFSMDTVTHVDPIDSSLFAPEYRVSVLREIHSSPHSTSEDPPSIKGLLYANI